MPRCVTSIAALALLAGCVTRHYAPPVNPTAAALALPVDDAAVAVGGFTSMGSVAANGGADADGMLRLSDRIGVNVGGTLYADTDRIEAPQTLARAGLTTWLGPTDRKLNVAVGGGGGAGVANGRLVGGPWATLGLAGTHESVRGFVDLGAQASFNGPYQALWASGRFGMDAGAGGLGVRIWLGPQAFAGDFRSRGCTVLEECWDVAGEMVAMNFSGGLALRVGDIAVARAR